jgi:hypothetical protein
MYYYILLSIFAVILYMMIVDANVAAYIDLQIKMLGLNIRRFYWLLRFHPKNPITNLIRKIEYAKILRQIEKDMKNKNV